MTCEKRFLQVGHIVSPIESLGPGRRLGIWLSGCLIAMASQPCPECISRDLWDPSCGEEIKCDSFAQNMGASIIAEELTGLTVTGGEPLDQYEPLCDFIELLQARCREQNHSLDTLLFTHHPSSLVKTDFPRAWALFDALICGKYRADLASETPLVASTNQELVILNPAVEQHYHQVSKAPRLQAFLMDGDLIFAGIPLRGEMDRITQSLADKGVEFQSVSWKE
jgi:anaerobic ribonucleoside-triphosphate reductase activating protein